MELSEEELKEVRRLEAKAQMEKQKVLKSKYNLYGAVLVDLNLTGLNLENANMAKANLSNANLSESNLSNEARSKLI